MEMSVEVFFFVMFRMSFLFIIKINFDLLIVTAIA